jgi:hypothetical protein
MTNETDSDSPSSDANNQPPRQPPVPPSTPPQGEVRPNSNDSPNNQQDTARELAREFRWVEGAQLVVNAILAIVGVVALLIYHGQLKVMSDTLTEIRNGKADTTRIITASETQATAANKIAGAAESFSKTAGNAADEFKKAAAESSTNQKNTIKDSTRSRSWNPTLLIVAPLFPHRGFLNSQWEISRLLDRLQRHKSEQLSKQPCWLTRCCDPSSCTLTFGEKSGTKTRVSENMLLSSAFSLAIRIKKRSACVPNLMKFNEAATSPVTATKHSNKMAYVASI